MKRYNVKVKQIYSGNFRAKNEEELLKTINILISNGKIEKCFEETEIEIEEDKNE